jgi:head-tail adaptor
MKRRNRLRTPLQLQYDSRSKDTDGFETASWTNKGAVRFCDVQPMQGREYWDAHAVLGSQPLKIRTYFDDTIEDVEPDRWRFKNDTTVYSIQSMINVNMENRWMEFICVTGTGVLD